MNTYEKLEEIIKQFQDGEAKELHFKTDDLEVYLSNDRDGSVSVTTPVQRPVGSISEPQPKSSQKEVEKPLSPTPAHLVRESRQKFEGGIEVVAPYMGTFYRSPKPGAAPYVEIGQTVAADTELCLVEVMKLFTAVRSGFEGVVREVLVEDGDMVEVGQALFVIEEKL